MIIILSDIQELKYSYNSLIPRPSHVFQCPIFLAYFENMGRPGYKATVIIQLM